MALDRAPLRHTAGPAVCRWDRRWPRSWPSGTWRRPATGSTSWPWAGSSTASAPTPPPRPGEPADAGRVHDRDLPPRGAGLLQPGGRHPRLAVRLHHPPGLDPDLAGWRPGTPPPRSDRATHARARAIPPAELLAFLDADHPLREKTLWWLLYETAARAGEVLALNIADLDLAARCAVVVGKGGRAEVIGWETKTARLLPRHLHRRRAGPLFLTDIAPAPARQQALADFDPATGRARLSYRRAAEIFTTVSGGWTLHQLRHSRLTHLAEAGVGLPMLMSKSRHTSLASLAIYAKPTFDAVAAATAALDPDRRR
jgi:integrase